MELIAKYPKEFKPIVISAWNCVDNCHGIDCPIIHICHYDHEGKCGLQLQYLDNLTKAIIEEIGSHLSTLQMHRVGTHLMPAYKMLCKAKMEELAISRVIFTSARGNPVSHPIYKEIRETMKLINTLWVTIGLEDINVKEPDPGELVDKDFEYDMYSGNPNFTERLADSSDGD